MGPLTGTRIIEIAGIGPGPFCGMLLADMGAEVIQVVRPGSASGSPLGPGIDQSGRRSLILDLKQPEAVEAVLKLCETADGLIEGFRPGVMERLGLGPDVCLTRSPRLVYGRVTGWGQDGPWSRRAGHDINYLALSGAMNNLGRTGEKPAIPLNYIADYAGGALFLAFGLVCGLLEARTSGRGQVIDAAMIDGLAALQAPHMHFYQAGLFRERGTHFLGGGHPAYEVYETRDGKYVALGALEPRFYDELIERLELDPNRFAGKAPFGPHPMTCQEAAELKKAIAAVIRTRTQEQWCEVFADSDACFAPVLNPEEAAEHPHHRDRGTWCEQDGRRRHRPAPRFSRTVPDIPAPPRPPGSDSEQILRELGLSDEEIGRLITDRTAH